MQHNCPTIDGVLPDGAAVTAGPGGKQNPGLELTLSELKSASLVGLITD